MLSLMVCGSAVFSQAGNQNQENSQPRNPALEHLKKIDSFEEKDKTSPPPENPVLFVGSSTIAMWEGKKLSEQMSPIPVLCRGVGGTTTKFQVDNFDRLTLKYHPKIIVYYAGDNDIGKNLKAKPETPFEGFKKYAELVKEKLPDTKIIYISIKPSIQRKDTWPIMVKANGMIKAFCESDPARTSYFDISGIILKPDGEPDPSLFAKDGLHMNQECYTRIAEKLKPLIQKISGQKAE